MEEASESLTAATQKSPQNADAAAALLMANQSLAKALLEAGKTTEAAAVAEDLLRKNRPDWNQGNVIYDAHTVLGRAALRDSKLALAREELLKAGATKGSPQLNSFGPDFILARELLEKGEKETVLKFLDQVAVFWTSGRSKIAAWKKEIEAGKIPRGSNWR